MTKKEISESNVAMFNNMLVASATAFTAARCKVNIPLSQVVGMYKAAIDISLLIVTIVTIVVSVVVYLATSSFWSCILTYLLTSCLGSCARHIYLLKKR